MSRFFIPCIVLLVAGCASSPVQLYEGSRLAKEEISVLTSSCDSECKLLVESKTKVKSKLYGPHIMGTVVQLVNGVVGTTNYSGHYGVYNDKMWFNYELEVLPGKQTLEVYVNHHMARSPMPIEIEIETIAGHSYFLGQLLDEPYLAEGSKYQWFPVVVDLTTKEFIYPVGDISWFHYP